MILHGVFRMKQLMVYKERGVLKSAKEIVQLVLHNFLFPCTIWDIKTCGNLNTKLTPK